MSHPESKSFPEYVRFPKREAGAREAYTNLAWATLDRLVRPQECNNFRPPVKSKLVRTRGKDSKRGARLIDLGSLLAYLGRQPILPEECKRPREETKQLVEPSEAPK
jgi:hypothetical protein